MTTPTTDIGFDCKICKQHHNSLPLALAFSMPDYVNKLLPWDREQHCKMSEDWCMVDDQLFWIRGVLEVPVQGDSKPFVWGVWATMNMDDFDTTMELWNDPERVNEPEYEGTLANTLPSYAETRGLKVRIRTRNVGERPVFYVEDSSHNLFRDQERGLSREDVIELAMFVLHGSPSNPYGYICESQP